MKAVEAAYREAVKTAKEKGHDPPKWRSFEQRFSKTCKHEMVPMYGSMDDFRGMSCRHCWYREWK